MGNRVWPSTGSKIPNLWTKKKTNLILVSADGSKLKNYTLYFPAVFPREEELARLPLE